MCPHTCRLLNMAERAPRFGLGFGKDTSKMGRPCNTQASHNNQKTVNRWFQRDDDGDNFTDERPPWWKEQDELQGAGRPPSVSRIGEWQLVWKPAKSKQLPLLPVKSSRSQQPPASSSGGVRRNWGPGSGPIPAAQTSALRQQRASTRHATKPPFGDNMTGVLTSGLLKTGIPGMTPPTRGSLMRPASVQGFVRSNSQVEVITSARSALSATGSVKPLRLPSRGPDISTFGSEPADSARSRLSTVSQQSLGTKSAASRRRLGTGNTMNSQRSVSSLGSSVSGSYSAYSDLTSASQQNEILKRIQGLEEALNAERSLRLQMQDLISTKVPAIPET